MFDILDFLSKGGALFILGIVYLAFALVFIISAKNTVTKIIGINFMLSSAISIIGCAIIFFFHISLYFSFIPLLLSNLVLAVGNIYANKKK